LPDPSSFGERFLLAGLPLLGMGLCMLFILWGAFLSNRYTDSSEPLMARGTWRPPTRLRVYATSKFCRVAPNALARAALLQPAASRSRMVCTWADVIVDWRPRCLPACFAKE
jgi:hypothetical protein